MRVWLCRNQIEAPHETLIYTQVSLPTSARARMVTADLTAGHRSVATSSTRTNRLRRVRTVVSVKRRTLVSVSRRLACSTRSFPTLREARRAGRARTARCRYVCRAISIRRRAASVLTRLERSYLNATQVLLRSHQGNPASAGRGGLLPLPEWGILYRS